MKIDRSEALIAIESIFKQLGIELVNVDKYSGMLMYKGEQVKKCKNAQHFGMLIHHGWKAKKDVTDNNVSKSNEYP